MDIQYIGEFLFPGYTGRAALFLGLFASLIAAFFYYRATHDSKKEWRLWRSWARRAFLMHLLLIGIASAMLLYLLLFRHYEYRYVWVHTENDLGLGYLVAAFWAGQEGSLLFWILCQAVFGAALMRYARTWEPTVMTVLSLSQVFMVAMVLGIEAGGFRIGMSPFVLLRETATGSDVAFFQNPAYLSMITDGNGLNPLLRNFWMMSHPPFTFIGYASVLVPFCFAIAGMWKKKYHEWLLPALPWTILGVFFLGIGILLGGVWAYESLTFGGFWAWDPIENASLVPWLVLVAALHLMLVSKHKKHSYFPTFLFTLLSFILVVYATYLTRSGILAETSVHSFGNDGMGKQILIYIFSLMAISAVLLTINFRKMPSKENEEPFTREFWLFVGALVMVLSAFQVGFTTSIPVLNKLIGTEFTPPANVVEHYNNWQLPFAVVIALLIAATNFITWGRNAFTPFIKKLLLSLILATIFAIAIALLYEMKELAHILLLFSSLFALFSSLDLLLRFRNKFTTTGASITHLGIALFLLAVLLTFSKKTTISQNTSGYFLGQQFSDEENLLLIKGDILPLGNYHAVYSGRSFDGKRLRYQIDFLKTGKDGEFYKAFSAYPAIQINERMGNVYEPYAKVFPLRDVFTYITFADVQQDLHGHAHIHTENFDIAKGDTVQIQNNKLVLADIRSTATPDIPIDPNNIVITATVEVHTHFNKSFTLKPEFRVTNGIVTHQDGRIDELDMTIRFKGISDTPNTIILEVTEEHSDFIIIKTIIFPFINLLWISMLVMLAGLWVSFRRRSKARPESRPHQQT